MTTPPAKPTQPAKSRRPMSLRGRLFGYLLTFALLMLATLWLLQVAYLDKFYEAIKTKQINEAAENLIVAMDEGNLTQVAYSEAQKRQICVSVYKVYNPGLVGLGMEEVCRADLLSDCTIHHMSTYDLASLYKLSAELQGQAYVHRFDRSLFAPSTSQQSLWQRLTNPQGSGIPASLIYSRMVRAGAGETYLLLLNASIAPVNATVTTLRLQLALVSLIFILLALVLAIILGRQVARPITRINKEAARLAEGDFSGNFDGQGYWEVAQLADTLNFASAELARSGQVQQDIVANLSHDLRTPLTMIGGYAEYMQDFPEEDHSESIQVIVDEVARLSHLVQDVLDESRLSAGVEELTIEEFAFTASLAQFIRKYNSLMEKDGYHITFTAEEDITLRGDEQRLLQAVGNLLNNALTHCGEGKRISVTQTCPPGRVRIEVEDHGPGIAPEDLPLIWQRYYRTDATQRRRHSSGLGLAIVKGILELHQASYGVESVVGQGSKFWFELPRE